MQATLDAYVAAARGAFAPNTERAVRADTAVFVAWCDEDGQSATLPAEPATVAAFVDAVAERHTHQRMLSKSLTQKSR